MTKLDRRLADLAARGRAGDVSADAFRASLRGSGPESEAATWRALLTEWSGLRLADEQALEIGESVLKTHEALVACLGRPVSLMTAVLHELHARRGLVESPRIVSKSEFDRLGVNSITDPLTGLYNRTFVDDHLDRELSRAERSGGVLSLILFDVAGLTAVNSRHGHPTGDALLAATAKRIRQSLRVVDAGCRFGGDEFLVMLPNTDIVDSLEVAERIRQRVSRVRLAPRTNLAVDLSYGVATYPLDGKTRRFLLKMSDVRLYEAKVVQDSYAVRRRYPRFAVQGLSVKLGSRRGVRGTAEIRDIGYGGLSFAYNAQRVPPLIECEVVHRFSAEAHPVTLRTVSVRPTAGGRLRVGCAYEN